MSRPKRFESKLAYQNWWRQNTPKGKANDMWMHLRERVGNRRGNCPTYVNVELKMTREEFVAWVIPELEEWSKTRPIQTATLDRKSNTGHYEISNLQLLTNPENAAKRNNLKGNR